MQDQSSDLVDEGPIPLAPAEKTQKRTCPMCFTAMAPEQDVCRNCRYDERIGPTSSTKYVEKASENPGRLCTNCGYDVEGLPDNVCPECGERFGFTGTLAAARRATEKKQVPFKEFRAAAIYGAIGLTGMVLIFLITKEFDLIGYYLARYVIRVPALFAVFVLCSIIWMGFDEPLPKVAAKLALILPFVDLVGLVAYGALSPLIPLVMLNMLAIHRWVQVLLLFVMLRGLFDVEDEDAPFVALAMVVVYTIMSIYVLQQTGLTWPRLF